MRAAAFGVPFQPCAGLHGSDLTRINNWKCIDDPYGSGVLSMSAGSNGDVFAVGGYSRSGFVREQAASSTGFVTLPVSVPGTGAYDRTVFDAPKAPLFDPTTGAPLVDASGNPISYAGIGTKWFIYPEFGLGTAYYYGRHFRWEANASGFTWPHHSTVWDADTSANFKYGHLELRIGAKGFHFKTSTNADFYSKGTFASGHVSRNASPVSACVVTVLINFICDLVRNRT